MRPTTRSRRDDGGARPPPRPGPSAGPTGPGRGALGWADGNRNYRVVTPDGDYVVRWSGSDAALLGIDRDAEQANTRCVFEAGVGAPVHFMYRPDLGVLVIGYLTGTSLENDSFADADVLGRAAVACRRLHAGPRFVDDFDMFARQAAYLRTVEEQGFPLPPGYADHTDAWAAVKRAVAARPRVTVPCNNDLLAGNFIDDGDRVWLIDYETPATTTSRSSSATPAPSASSRPSGSTRMPRPTTALRPAATWPGSGSGPSGVSTGGRCGVSSRRRAARSTSTSTTGGCTGSRRRRVRSPPTASTGSWRRPSVTGCPRAPRWSWSAAA